MSQFADLISESVVPVLTELFGDVAGGIYTPDAGGGTPIACSLVVTTTRAVDKDRRTEDERETYQIMVPREVCAHVKRGDQYLRPAAEDPDRRPLICSGEASYRSAAYGVWKFTRMRRTVQGKGIGD